MGILFKLLLFFGIFYFGFRMLTKPFRDYVKQARKQAEMSGRQSSNRNPSKKTETKTENVGEYIDYEEIDE